jgi:hypothetical protein
VAAGAGGEAVVAVVAVVAAGATAVAACPGEAAACARRDCNSSIDKQLHAGPTPATRVVGKERRQGEVAVRVARRRRGRAAAVARGALFSAGVFPHPPILKLRRIRLIRKGGLAIHFEKKPRKISTRTRTLTPLI